MNKTILKLYTVEVTMNTKFYFLIAIRKIQ